MYEQVENRILLTQMVGFVTVDERWVSWFTKEMERGESLGGTMEARHLRAFLDSEEAQVRQHNGDESAELPVIAALRADIDALERSGVTRVCLVHPMLAWRYLDSKGDDQEAP